MAKWLSRWDTLGYTLFHLNWRFSFLSHFKQLKKTIPIRLGVLCVSVAKWQARSKQDFAPAPYPPPNFSEGV